MIPVAEPRLGPKELEYVSDCITSGWVSSRGKYVNLFESDFAAYCDCQYGVATFNGTIAQHLALAALNIGPGDEVIVPTLTFIATANAVSYTGATPIFVDSDPETWTLDPNAVEAAVTARTKAIVPVHLYGHPADMDAINAIAKHHNLLVIEDAAEAHGARYKGQRVGSLSDAAFFSFMGNKIITTGEGGIIVTNDAALAERCIFLEDHARDSDNPYWHTEIGFNYRMTNLQAAVGLGQLEQIDAFIAIRRRNATLYMDLLRAVPGITPPPQAAWAENVYWMFAPLIEPEFGLDRDTLIRELRDHGIDSRPFFYPIHTMPMYNTGQSLPVAESLSARGINLPSGTTLTEGEIAMICEVLGEICSGER